MKVLLYIKVTKEPSFVYDNPLVKWASSALSDCVSLEIDNFSDSATLNIAKKIIVEAKKVVILAEAQDGAKAGGAIRLIEQALKKKEAAKLTLCGKHAMLQHMGKAFKDNFHEITSINEAKNILEDFLHE